VSRHQAERGRWTLVVVIAVLAAACGHTSAAPTPTTPITNTSVASSAPTLTTVGGHLAVVELSDADNGRIVSVRRGDSITIVLNSTYWSMLAPTNTAVLEPRGPPVVVPRLQGCVPGQGCGTVTAHYLALSTGQSQLAAHRETCGEAMSCTPDHKDWRATVTIS